MVMFRFGVYPNVRYNKRVTSATWDKKLCKWIVETQDGDKYIGNVLISGKK